MLSATRHPADTFLDPLLGMLFARGRVEHIEQVTPYMRLIRIGGPDVRALGWIPGQHIRVRAKDPIVRLGLGPLRTYSVWSYDGMKLELCVLDHGDGPGARWSRSVELGDSVTFRRPEGSFVVRPEAVYHVFIGEETASVAFGAMLRDLPSDALVFGAVEVPGPDDRLPLPRSSELTWCYRGSASAEGSARLMTAARELDLPDEPGIAYVAGEARTCQAVRNQLVGERGWPRRSVIVKPFWAPGRRGME